MNRRRGAGFVGVCLLAVAIAVAALLTGTRRAEEARQPTAATRLDNALDAAEVRSGPNIVFRSTAHGPTYGRLGVVPLSRPSTGREVPLIGIPSRARLSPDGTLAATTAFVEGHSRTPTAASPPPPSCTSRARAGRSATSRTSACSGPASATGRRTSTYGA